MEWDTKESQEDTTCKGIALDRIKMYRKAMESGVQELTRRDRTRTGEDEIVNRHQVTRCEKEDIR